VLTGGNSLEILILNITTILINVFLLILFFLKYRQLVKQKNDYNSLKNDLDELLYENSFLSSQFLDDLEAKISEGKTILHLLKEKEKDLKKSSSPVEEKGEKYNPIPTEITSLLEQGMSINEIAEKLNTTKGELVLRLNLGEKIINKPENPLNLSDTSLKIGKH